MLTFKSLDDLNLLSPANPAHDIIRKIVESSITEGERSGYPYDPEADGYVVFIQRCDLDGKSPEVWNKQALMELLWEGVHRESDHYVAVYFSNNQFGLTFVIADDGSLPTELRNVLEDNLVPTPENSTNQP